MSLTWKDGVTTLLALVVAGIFYARTTNGMELPLISNGYRWAIVALTIAGIGMCAFSSGANNTGGMNIFLTVAGILGVAALILIVYGLVTGTKLAFMLLTGVIIALWIIATLRHIIQFK